MSKKRKHSDPNFEEVGLDEFIEIVGRTMFDEQINPLIYYSYERDTSNKQSTIDITLLYNAKEDLFHVKDSHTGVLILIIEKANDATYFCKPMMLLDYCSRIVLREHRRSPLYATLDTEVYAEMEEDENVSDYFYYLGVLLVDELGLDLMFTKLIHASQSCLIIDGQKKEFVDTELNQEVMLYMITLSSNSKEIKITKMDPRQPGVAHKIHLALEDLWGDF